ncbi:MAG TPA: hypothetical protein ENF78_04445 [Candidatus Bathyarchaeota archaeon]|nr:hypothetical protein [Candidatus Bathyarchaeota archaeon]
MPARRGKAYYARKVKKAAHMLFFKRHYRPGAWGWELKKAIGPDYIRVLKVLDGLLRPLDLTVKQVFELPSQEVAREITAVPEVPEGAEGPREAGGSPDEARYYVVLRGTLEPSELKYCGWRVDDIAALAMSIGLILARGGKAPRADVEALLKEKLPDWRVRAGLERFLKAGYIGEDEGGMLYLGWRTLAEVDLKALLNLLMRYEAS